MQSYSIFREILNRGRNPQAKPLEHHQTLHRMLLRLDLFLAMDLKRLEKILEKKIQRDRAFLENVNEFINTIAYLVFRNEYKEIAGDYHQFIKYFTFYDLQLEHILRQHYLRLIACKFKIDYPTGTTNLLELKTDIINITDRTIIKIMRAQALAYQISPSARVKTNIEMYLDDDPVRFLNAMQFFAIIMLISNIAIQILKQKTKPEYEKQIETITKIYYGHSLSLEQFKLLIQNNLVGGIIFRGEYFVYTPGIFFGSNLHAALKRIKAGPSGTHWTTDWGRAVYAASSSHQVYKELENIFNRITGIFILNETHFDEMLQSLLHRRDKIIDWRLLIDDNAVAANALRKLISFKKLGVGWVLENAQIGIIYSYPIINEKTLLYFGSEHIGRLPDFANEKEVFIKPRFFKPNKYSIDVALKLDLINVGA
jgi:hypothetical protein